MVHLVFFAPKQVENKFEILNTEIQSYCITNFFLGILSVTVTCTGCALICQELNQSILYYCLSIIRRGEVFNGPLNSLQLKNTYLARLLKQLTQPTWLTGSCTTQSQDC